MYENDYTEWKPEDVNYLLDMWGEKSPNLIAKELKRKPSAVRRKAEKLKLSSNTTGYLLPSEIGKILNKEAETIRYWITNSGLKAVKKKYLRRNSYLIDPKDIKEFLVANPEKWKASNMDKENPLGIDEKWLSDKILSEQIVPNDKKLWTVTEEHRLLQYINEGKNKPRNKQFNG